MTEWIIPTHEDSLSQGDILVSRDPKTREYKDILWTITADCDLSKVKFGTHIACLRITSLKQYMIDEWADRKLIKLIDDETEKMRDILTKWNNLRTGQSGRLSLERVRLWVMKASVEGICTQLKVDEKNIQKVSRHIKDFQAFLELLNEKRDENNFLKLVYLKAYIDKKDFEECRKSISKKALGESLPNDVFLLPDLPQIEIGPCLVGLRELVAIPFAKVFLNASGATNIDDFYRIGRQKDMFKYAISQAFASLYSRIGLSETYEDRCKIATGTIESF